ncbi:MAG: hypothetical protein M5R42_20540 [Rhodocyclaceae bacterium]|nr:hypothetical protein [Rhodocyclaceae bacterium]
MALTPVRRIRSALMKDLGLPDNVLDFINYPTRFDCRDTEKGPGRYRHRRAAAGNLCLAAVGLLGTSPRSRSLHRPHPEGAGQGQGRAGHRRLLRHRQGRRPQGGRGRRHHHHRRARPGKTGRDQARVRGRRTGARRLFRRHRPLRAMRRFRQAGSGGIRRGGHRHQQRRPLHPPRHRELFRPLPRLRALHAAQLLRGGARGDGASCPG